MTEKEVLGLLVECYDGKKDELDFKKFEIQIIEIANEDT